MAGIEMPIKAVRAQIASAVQFWVRYKKPKASFLGVSTGRLSLPKPNSPFLKIGASGARARRSA